MIFRIFLFLICFSFYSISFALLDETMQSKPIVLQEAPPLILLKVVSGYLKQVTAEMLFVKTSVFLGGVKAGVDSKSYESELAQNLKTMTDLYSAFKDPYYYSESFLAPISKESALDANSILETGIETYPDNFVFRFFYAFNYYRYLEDPLKAAAAFDNAAKRDGAPAMFGHLAAVFSAQGGNLTAGLIMLQTMLRGEKDEFVRNRYKEEIEMFQKAIHVEKALSFYKRKYNKFPNKLSGLVPEFLPQIPSIKDIFILVYDPPNIFLKRP